MVWLIPWGPPSAYWSKIFMFNSLAEIATFKVSFFRMGNSNSLAGNEQYDQKEGDMKANKTIENEERSPGFSPEPAYIIK